MLAFYFRGEDCFNDFQIDQAFECWLYVLEDLIEKKEPMRSKIISVLYTITYGCYSLNSLLFDFGVGVESVFETQLPKVKLSIIRVMQIFEKQLISFCTNYNLKLQNIDSNEDQILCFVHFLAMVALLIYNHKKYWSTDEINEVKKPIREILKFNPKFESFRDRCEFGRYDGRRLIHVALDFHTYKQFGSMGSFDFDISECNQEFFFNILKLLLSCNANPNEYDKLHRSPLHYVAIILSNLIPNLPNGVDSSCLISILLKHGTHIDSCDLNNETPYNYLRKHNIDIADLRPQYHINLKCLAARAVCKYKINYKETVPRSLLDFIAYHGTIESHETIFSIMSS
jgi:hypothetical protein